MITFPNCKINLGLNIVRKRSDGYHDLETVFYPIGLRDIVEAVEINNQSPISNFQFSTSGLPVEGEIEKNLCVKAYHLLKKDFPQLPAVSLHLHKAIPMGAGLGGGSADGTFTLRLLNKKFALGLLEKKLLDYALQLGSDCPFFMLNNPCYATGRGEKLEPLDLDLSMYTIILVHPCIHISTAESFAAIQPSVPPKSVREIIQHPITNWKQELKNDFEISVFTRYPEIKGIKEKLYQAGAVYVSMSGSGSAVFGIFEKENNVAASFPAHYFVQQLTG